MNCTDNSKQVRIFIPFNGRFDLENWCEQLLGEVIKPLIEKYKGQIDWFWFSRYGSTRNGDIGDCDITRLTPEYFQNDFHISLRFRINTKIENWDSIRKDCDALISKVGVMHTGWLDYPVVSDLAHNRFAPLDFSPTQRKKRAELIVGFLYANSKLVLDCLKQNTASGKWGYEENIDKINNPLGSIFESVNHLFCNIGNVFLPVYIFEKHGQIGLGTVVYPLSPEEGWRPIASTKIRF